MKKNTILALFLLAFTIAPLTASTGWYWDYIILNVNDSVNNYYRIGNKPKVYTQFDKTDLGIVDSLKIAGCDMRYWSDTKDRTSGSFFYKIMSEDGNTEIIPPVETIWNQTEIGGIDYQGTKKMSIDLLSGLDYNTTYQLYVWAKSSGTDYGDSWLHKVAQETDSVIIFTKHDSLNNKWNGIISSDWNDARNWTANVVPSANASLVFDKTSIRPCQLDQNRIVKHIVNCSAYPIITNGNKLTITGNLYLTNGAKIDASSANSTIEFAGNAGQIIPNGAFLNNNVYDLTINNSNNVKLIGTLNLLNTITTTSGKLDVTTYSPAIAYSGVTGQSIESDIFLNNTVHDLIIDNAVGVSLSADFTVNHLLTINSGKILTIPTEKQLNVVGTITNNAGVDGLVIKSSPTGEVPNGTLLFHNVVGAPVQATVEMYSKAFRSTNYKWQFFGIPLRSMLVSPTFDGSYVRQMFENENPAHWYQLNNASSLMSFIGYEITQVSPRTVYFQGELENSDFNSGKLSYTSTATYSGQHLIGNPYTAAINIDKIVLGSSNSDIIENTIFMYNTGSYDDWINNTPTNGTLPGQYTAIPLFNAGAGGLPSQIPSMQAFLIIVNSDNEAATITIPYSAAATMAKNTDIQRAPSANKAGSAGKVYTIIDVKGSRYADKMWIFSEPTCTHGFDNGWDGTKTIGSSLAPQLFSMEKDGNYQVNTVDDINETEIGFQAGEDKQYTLTFTHSNLKQRYNAVYLIDLLENKTIDITQSGSTYSFVTHSTSTPVKRFKIVTSIK